MQEGDFQPGSYARALRIALCLILLGLGSVVAFIQFSSDEALERGYLRQQSRLVYVPGRRGSILSREGTLLNHAQPSYSIVLRMELVRDPRDTRRSSINKISSAASALGVALGPEFYRQLPTPDEIGEHIRQKPALPLVLWDNVSSETIARWASLRSDFPWSELQLSWRRCYEYPGTAVQWRGRTASAYRSYDGTNRYWNASAPELHGVSGMEAVLDENLRGVPGSEKLQTDVLSYRTRILESRPAEPGEECRLSLSLPAQLVAEQAFAELGANGAAVAIDMASGEVLVMHSSPSQPFGSREKAPSTAEMNRALAGYYPPGSVLKPLLALYAMEKGIAPHDWTSLCGGGFSLTEKLRIGCTGTHGTIGFETALSKSCNTFFCALASRMNHEELDGFAAEFGFGSLTGSLLQSQENRGIPFSPAWVREHRRDSPRWYAGDSANAGIGQGGWIVTPMQMTLAVNYALTGNLLVPKFTLGADAEIRRSRQWNPVAKRIVMNGMKQCALTGTARRAMNIPGFSALAKTGTAENIPGKAPHAWTIAAAPADNPRFLVTVTVEHGGGGGSVAAPIARDILKALMQENSELAQ